jgi:hypothetical protein
MLGVFTEIFLIENRFKLYIFYFLHFYFEAIQKSKNTLI